MKKTAIIVAALMVSGAAIAQTDPYDTTTDTDVSAQGSMTTEMDATTSTDTTVDTDTMVDTDTTMDTTATTVDTTASTTTDTTMGPASTATGVGGPYQTAMNAPSSKGDYPACDPGPGDDNCIQLYERGVSTETNLAMNENLGDGSTMMASADTSTWNNEVGATADAMATGTGGPYEPVTGDTSTPTEARDVAGTDYPACDPGPGDDNCIQLYERGVTGEIE